MDLEPKDAQGWLTVALGAIGAVLYAASSFITKWNDRRKTGADTEVIVTAGAASRATIQSLVHQLSSIERRYTAQYADLDERFVELRREFDDEREARIAAEDGEATCRRELENLRSDLDRAKRRLDQQDTDSHMLRGRIGALESQIRDLGHEPNKN